MIGLQKQHENQKVLSPAVMFNALAALDILVTELKIFPLSKHVNRMYAEEFCDRWWCKLYDKDQYEMMYEDLAIHK